MAKTTCFRVQPAGLEIAGHHSETSNDNLAIGCHVFGSLSELKGAVQWWVPEDWRPEVLTIECENRDLRDNGDYEGYVLAGNRGEIVARKAFSSWVKLIAWAKK